MEPAHHHNKVCHAQSIYPRVHHVQLTLSPTTCLPQPHYDKDAASQRAEQTDKYTHLQRQCLSAWEAGACCQVPSSEPPAPPLSSPCRPSAASPSLQAACKHNPHTATHSPHIATQSTHCYTVHALLHSPHTQSIHCHTHCYTVHTLLHSPHTATHTATQSTHFATQSPPIATHSPHTVTHIATHSPHCLQTIHTMLQLQSSCVCTWY